jgi:hypothetical protein
MLSTVREQQIVVIERMRDRSAGTLTGPDNTLKLAKARSRRTRLAGAEIDRRLPGVIEKYRDRIDPQDLHSPEVVPLALKVLLEQSSSIEEQQRALDQARKQVERGERDEYEALQAAVPDLIRLERYERRTWSLLMRALRDFIAIKSRHA